MYKAIIFDLDGTLADTLGDLQTAVNTMLRHYGYKERTKEELLRFINRGVKVFVGLSLPEGTITSFDDKAVADAVKVYQDSYAGCYADSTREYPGITEALLALKKKYLLGVLSNKNDKFVKMIIDKLFPGIFDSVNGHSSLPEKPDPSAAYFTAEDLGVNPEECIFVGDADLDMQTAINSGMYPIGVTWGYRNYDVLKNAGAKALATTADELYKIICNLKK